MSEIPQLERDENIDLTTVQPDEPADTGMGNGLAKAAIVGKQTSILSENKQPLEKHDKKVDSITGQADAQPVDTGMGNWLAKAAIVGVVGAVVGTVASALAHKRTAQSLNRTVKGVGDAVKGAAQGVNDTVKGTVDRVKDTVEDAKPSDNQNFKLYEERLVADKKQVKTAEVSIGKYVETQIAHISVPLKKERLVVEQTTLVDAGTPVAPGEANFHEGEIARMEVYEETANVHKQAFVREEVSIRKEVEQDTVEVEDTIRREELYLDTQGHNDIDKTETL